MNEELVDVTVDFLNELLTLDPVWVKQMVEFKPQCNKEIADHPTVICWDDNGTYYCRLVGLLNGLLQRLSGVDREAGPISMDLDEATGEIIKFRRWVKPIN